MKVKMCGLKRMEDIRYVNEVKPDYAGFVFAKSKRKVTSIQAKKFREEMDASIKAVGVFVNEPLESMLSIAREVPLDVIQLHGDEGEADILALKEVLHVEIWKAVRVKDLSDIEEAQKLSADKLLFDSFCKEAYGGTGRVMDIDLIKKATIIKPFFVAGGLNIENTDGIIKQIAPYGIDISSGIETDEWKDLESLEVSMYRKS